MSLISETLEIHHIKFNSRTRPHLFQAPGRVNLIGEHTDYNDGFVLPVAIDRQIVVAATTREDTRINVYALDFEQWDSFDFKREIARFSENTWCKYIRAIVWSLLQEGYELQGVDMVIAGDIPIGAGLSSSAALEVAVGFTLLQLSEVKINRKSLALAAQKAENDFVGMRCGIMDQFIACLGQINNALLIDCRDLSYEAVPLPIRAQIVIVDSGVHRGLMDMEYNDRRRVCETAARRFGVSTLRDIDLEKFKSRSHELSPVVYRRAHHVITENARTLSATEALKADDLHSFGNLMIASHNSLRDDFEVSCPELDLLVEIALSVKGVYGARLTGAGFGGCMVAFVEQKAVDDLISAINEQYSQVSGRQANVYICNASEGVSELDSLSS
jgi:galactokinase